jgi:Pyridoxamine 5'-phosphate oxidase
MRAVAMRKRLLDDDHRPDEDNRSAAIPATHLDLVECPRVAALSTVTPDGYPQTTVVWCDFDGECLCVNTMRGFAKERNCAETRGSPSSVTTRAEPSATSRSADGSSR